MSLDEGDVVYQRRAFDNVFKALDFDRTLPDRVHVGPWSDFLFFPSDHVFALDFPEVVREPLSVERVHVACLLNLDATERFAFDSIAAIFLDEMINRLLKYCFEAWRRMYYIYRMRSRPN